MKIVKSILFQDRSVEMVNKGTPQEEIIELIPEKRIIIYYIDDQEILDSNKEDFTMMSKLMKLDNLVNSNESNCELSRIGDNNLIIQLLSNLQSYLQDE
jgi:hypothetical protein